MGDNGTSASGRLLARYTPDMGKSSHLIEIPNQEPVRTVRGNQKFKWDVPDGAHTLCGQRVWRDRALVIRTPDDFEAGVCRSCRSSLKKGIYGGMTREITATHTTGSKR